MAEEKTCGKCQRKTINIVKKCKDCGVYLCGNNGCGGGASKCPCCGGHHLERV